MIIEFDKENHVYTVNGTVRPSVTEMISWALKEDYSTIKDEILLPRRDFGNDIHDLTARRDWGMLEDQDIPEKYRKHVQRWGEFIEQYEILHIEKPFVADEGFCGTPDRILVKKATKRLTILDLKTTSEFHRKFGLQLSFYAKLFCDFVPNLAWDDIDLEIAQMDFNGNIITKKYDDEWPVCKAIFDLYKWVHKNKRGCEWASN